MSTALFGNTLKYCTILGNISVYATRNATRHQAGLEFTRLFGGFDSRYLLFLFAPVNTGFFLYLQGFSLVLSVTILRYSAHIFRCFCNTNATRKSHVFQLFKMLINFLCLPYRLQVDGIPVYRFHNIVRDPPSALENILIRYANSMHDGC